MSLTTNLVSYWGFNQSSGNATDSIGGMTLTNTSGTYSAGKVGNAWNGTGSSTYLLESSYNSGSQTTFSFGLWFKTTSTGRADLIDFYKSDFSTVAMIQVNGYSGGSSAGRVTLNLYYSSANHFSEALKTGLNDGNWHLVVATVTGSATAIYIDGVSVGTNTNGSAMSLDYVSVGGDINNTTNYLNGSVDELGYWQRGLVQTDVNQLYNSGAGTTYPFTNIPLYWVETTANWDATTTTYWAYSSGGPGGATVPNSTNPVYFDGNSGTGIITITAAANALSLTTTNFGGTLSLSNSLTVSGAITGGGTINANGQSLSAETLTNSGTVSMGASTITLNGTGTVCNLSGTVTPGTSTIVVSDISSSSKTFAGGGLTYY